MELKYTKKEFREIIKEIVFNLTTKRDYIPNEFSKLKERLEREEQTIECRRIIDSIDTYQDLCKVYQEHLETLQHYNVFNQCNFYDCSTTVKLQSALQCMYEDILYANDLIRITTETLDNKKIKTKEGKYKTKEELDKIIDNEIDKLIKEYSLENIITD